MLKIVLRENTKGLSNNKRKKFKANLEKEINKYI